MTATTHHARLLAALLLVTPVTPVACGELATSTVDQGVAPPSSFAAAGADSRSPGTPPNVGGGGQSPKDAARGGSPQAAGHSPGSSGAGGREAAHAGASGADTAGAGGAAGSDGDASGSAGSADQPGGSAGAPTVDGASGHADEGGGAGGGADPIGVGGGAAGFGSVAVEPGPFSCSDVHWLYPPALDAYVRVVGKAPLIGGVPASRIVARWRGLPSEIYPFSYITVYKHALVGPDGTFDLGTATEAASYELTVFAEPASGEPWQFDPSLDRATPPLTVVAGKEGDVTNVLLEAFTVDDATLFCSPGRPPGVRIPGKK